jgi:hypothetical protein
MRLHNNRHTATVWFLALVASCFTWSPFHFFVTASAYWTLVRFVGLFPLTMIAWAIVFAFVGVWNTDREARNARRALRSVR